MVATVEICESNGSSETVTHNVTNLNCGDTEAANLDYAAFPIPQGQNAYAKLARIHWSAGTANKLDNFQAYKSAGAYKTGEGIQASLHTVQGNYDTVKVTTYTQGTKTTYTAYAIPEADPAAANLGIGGSLTGNLVAVGYSDYLKFQLQTTGSTPQGDLNTKTITFQYDEQ
jgi:hypothetical protein